jgi:hypothetical protein
MGHLFEDWKQNFDREKDCSELVLRYSLYSRQLFSAYEPLLRDEALTERTFLNRLDKWLRNWTDEQDQWDAFRLVDRIFFVGVTEFQELFRVAFETNLWAWVAKSVAGHPASEETRESIKKELSKTWCCPITDSFRINAFRHINHIETPDYFPDWRSLEKFGDRHAISKYIKSTGITRIVLLEDFVGSFTQAKKAVEFAASFELPVLVLPLIIGKRGHDAIKEIALKHPNVTYDPVMWLNTDFLVSEQEDPQVESENTWKQSLVESYATLTQDKFPYGFEQEKFGENQGYLVVLYTNCPNNTINLIHTEHVKSSTSIDWLPLFPRSGRSKSK